MKQLTFRILFVLLIILTTTTGCTTARDIAEEAISQRDQLVALAQGVQAAAANFNLVLDTQYGKIRTSNQVTQAYYEAVAQAGEVWTGNFRSEQAAFEDALANATDPSAYISADQPNLADMALNGGLPTDTGPAFILFLNAVVQAPPPEPDPAVTLALLDTVNEAMNSVQLAGTDWNDAVREYNTLRSSVSGEIVAEASEIIGFPLPDNFPYYKETQPGDSQDTTVTDPLSTPTPQ